MATAIRLSPRAKRLLDHTDTDIVDRYRDYLLESPDRHLWLSKSVLVDVDGIIRRRFACDSHLCLKHRVRDGQIKVKTKYSCCWDLEVQLLPTEIEAIEKHLPKVLAHHPAVKAHADAKGFWEHDEEWWKILQKKKRGDCVFLDQCGENGQSLCSLHATALREKMKLGDIKPLICRMFPIFILETDDVNIITFYCEETHPILFADDEYEKMHCLHANEHATEPVYRHMRDALLALVGEDGYAKIESEAKKILARDAKKTEGNGSS